MILEPTPDVRRDVIVIGSAIRKTPDIVRAYLTCLGRQRAIPGVDVCYHFIIDTPDPEVRALVAEFLRERDGTAEGVEGDRPEYDDNHPVTHQWSGQAMQRVGQLKNRIIAKALSIKAAALWFCDADLLCDPDTLRSLWYADQPVTCAVYWTRWHSAPQINAAPQVWLRHPYDLTGRGYDEASFRSQLQSKQLTQVWGQGACTLIRKEVLEQGVTFSYVPGISTEGMMGGEDRHFCIACEQRHIPMYADPWPHIFHCYHPEDREKLDYWVLQFASVSCETPRWVNLRLQMLEPVPTGKDQFGHMHPEHVRVRVGCGQLLPDLEAQVLDHLDGQPFMAAVNYPITHPIAWLRNVKRLIEVTVVSHTDREFPPVLADEIVRGMDLTRYTRAQQEVSHG